MAVMLDVKNINVYYGAIHAVKDISFQVNEGGDCHPHRRQRRGQDYHTANRVRSAPHPHRLH